jgi:endonuclease G
MQPFVTNSCTTCNYFRKDPYDINILRHEDYTNTGYDRGHLVPNADYGVDTYIITNAVPMIPKFNRGIWRVSEQAIREKYKGKLIYKGCEYSNNYIMTSRSNKLYIPAGCFYVVFDSNNINQISELELLDYGYLKNDNTLQRNIKKLPDWVDCSGKKNTLEA